MRSRHRCGPAISLFPSESRRAISASTRPSSSRCTLPANYSSCTRCDRSCPGKLLHSSGRLTVPKRSEKPGQLQPTTCATSPERALSSHCRDHERRPRPTAGIPLTERRPSKRRMARRPRIPRPNRSSLVPTDEMSAELLHHITGLDSRRLGRAMRPVLASASGTDSSRMRCV
jgi:hypothetical protein